MKADRLWGSRLTKSTAKGLLDFTSGRDVRHTSPYDQRLIPYDVWGSKAHVVMLWKQGLVTKKEVKGVLKGLNEVEASYRKGTFRVDPAKEDVHSTIENFLITRYGMESAGRLHTGRSRNDQVVVDMRLYLRAEVLEYISLVLNLIDALVDVAKRNVTTVVPGYTHYQPAMITSWGHLLFSYAVSLARDAQRLQHWHTMFNNNPLGGAAGYGTGLPLDRDLTARLMGFDGVHESSLDPPQNRWEPEVEMCFSISVMMNHMSSLAQTLLVLSTSEFDMVQIDESYCTGSSLMPQKRNADPLEVIKGKAAYTHGMVMTLLSLGRSCFAGYNRDSQWSKYPVMDVIDECKPSLTMMKDIIKSLKVNKKTALSRCGKAFITATDVVEWLVQKHHLPFREAKIAVEKAVKYAEKEGGEKITAGALRSALREEKITLKFQEEEIEQCQVPACVLRERKTKGGPSPRVLKGEIARFEGAVQRYRDWLKEKIAKVEKARAELRKMVNSLT